MRGLVQLSSDHHGDQHRPNTTSIAELRQRILLAGPPPDAQYTAILPQDGLYLWDWGNLDGDRLVPTPKKVTAKFVRAFVKTWARLPEADRETLLHYWHMNDYRCERYRPEPRIEFNSMSLPRHMAAGCGCEGYILLFSVRHVEEYKPFLLQHVIAHELGHAMSHAHGWSDRHECLMDRGGECTACECQAYSYMAHWEFDPFHGRLPAGDSLAERFSKAMRC